MANKMNFKLTETPWVLSDDGDVIGVQSRSGVISYFPATVSQDAITAFAGGGQGSAVQLKYRNSRVTIVGTAADSVKLPKAIAGLSLTVANAAAANSLNVFPSTGEFIDAGAVNVQVAIVVAKQRQFVCMVNGTWSSNLSA